MSERKLATFGSDSRPPQLDTGGGPLEENQFPTPAAVDTTRSRLENSRPGQRRSPGGSLAPAPTPTPTSLLSLRPTSAPRSSPGAIPAARQLGLELVGGDMPAATAAAGKGWVRAARAGGGSRAGSPRGEGPPSWAAGAGAPQDAVVAVRSERGSPERAAGGVVMMATVGDSATRQLKEASRFWLVRLAESIRRAAWPLPCWDWQRPSCLASFCLPLKLPLVYSQPPPLTSPVCMSPLLIATCAQPRSICAAQSCFDILKDGRIPSVP